jgi:large subunit ribosomal protein L23Ae
VKIRFNEYSGKAKKVATALKKGSGRKATRIHTKVHFFRPKTLKLPRNPKIVSTAVKGADATRAYDIIKFPLTTESAMKKIEENNTLVFIVGLTSNKRQIKDAVKKLYDIQAEKVNTLIRFVNLIEIELFIFSSLKGELILLPFMNNIFVNLTGL